MSQATNRQEQIAGAWSRAASDYGQIGPPFFQYFDSELVEFARIPPGAKVLDVATGRGAALFPAAEKVGPSGQVTGIDYSQGMVDATDADLNSRSILNASVLPMDAGRLEFPNNSFDPVLCGFALFFFPDSGRVLREFHRVLGTGGRIALSIWEDDDHRWSWLEDLRKQSAPTAQEATPGFDTPEGLEQALGQAGFRNIEFKRVEREFFFASAEEWWAAQWSHGARIYLEQIPPNALEQARAFAFAQMAKIAQPEGIRVLLQALFAAATRP